MVENESDDEEHDEVYSVKFSWNIHITVFLAAF